MQQEDNASKRNRLDVISSLLENKLKTLNGLDDEVHSLCPLEDITNEIEESEDIVARIIDCQRQIEESRMCRLTSTVGSRVAIRGIHSARSTQHYCKQFCETTTSKVITAEIQRRRYEMAIVLGFLQIRYSRKQ